MWTRQNVLAAAHKEFTIFSLLLTMAGEFALMSLGVIALVVLVRWKRVELRRP